MLSENDFDKENISQNETFIAQAMNYLKHMDPAHASREDAISYLEFMQNVGERAAKSSTMDFDAFYEEYRKQQG